MSLRTALWTEVTTSAYAHERAALAFLRERLPDREPFRVWTNFMFIADDGTRNEVDALAVTPTGVYLIEIKSHPGRMAGDAGTWTWTRPEGPRRTLDNPLLLAERKAQKLKSLLLRQPAFRDRRIRGRGFYLRAVVFLANPDLVVALNEAGRTDVYGPDPVAGAAQANTLPGLVQRLVTIDPRRGPQVDRPLSLAIAHAVDQAGIHESTAHRRVGLFELRTLIAEGKGWQDFKVEHPHAQGVFRRIRIYLAGRAQAEDERESLQRAAQRAFRFLQGIDHPGIDRPLEIVTSNPRGPAIVFELDPEARRLDHWLADHAQELDLLDRIELVRQLAETLRHAHRQGLFHRALAPAHITVVKRNGRPHLRIHDWQAAARRFSGDSRVSGTSNGAEMFDEQTHVYLAPETLRLSDAQPEPADVWSLGAVAFLILASVPPAPDLDGLHALLLEHGSLTLASAMEAADRDLDFVIRQATMVDAESRLVSVDEFLGYLDAALDLLTSHKEPDPLDAGRGDVVGGEWTVSRRFGSGSTAVVLLTERDNRPEVLKVARDDVHGRRLDDEHAVLSALRHPRIIGTYGLLEIAGRTVLRLEAALGTLADELRAHGALSLDLLQRYGLDLLEALVYLDVEGVAHRDIKPDNLGIAERGKNDEHHLVLFDFSLTRADPTDIRVGTLAYLDPFLEEREPRRWDDQAERYAVAVTLHEMATGVRPVWGEGSTDPLLTDLWLPAIDRSRFDPAVRDRLVAFFSRALHRDPLERFDTAEDMRRAFEQVFAGVGGGAADEGVAAADVDLLNVTPSSPIAELGVGPRIRNALDRLDVATAGQLVEIPAAQLVRLGGIGATTRREVTHLAQRLRERFGDLPAAGGLGVASIDVIARQLVPRPPADEDHRTAIAGLLGLVPGPSADWPTVSEAVADTGLGRAVAADALASARTRWRNRPEITAVRGELVDLLRRRDGVAGADELAAMLLTVRGSLATEPMRSRRARAVVRAAVEAESDLATPRIVARRIGEALLLALDSEIAGDEGPRIWDAYLLTEAAALLGERAERLVTERPLPTLEEVIADLRVVAMPDGIGPFGDTRLIRLAAAASPAVAVSPRLELYPRGLAAADALSEARGALLNRRGLTEGEVVERVRARFPEAERLPSRPDLDALLLPLGLEWDRETNRYVLPHRGGLLPTFTTTSHTTAFPSPDERDAAIRGLEDRLGRLRRDGGFLALTVDLRRLGEAAPAVAAFTGGVAVDLERLLIGEMRAHLPANASWDAILSADAAPPQDRRRQGIVRRLVDLALPTVEQRLRGTAGIAVVTGAGLLARYDRLALLERLRDDLTRGRRDDPLTGLVVLVPGDDPSARPTIDGHPVPVITANQWAHLPGAWLRDAEAA